MQTWVLKNITWRIDVKRKFLMLVMVMFMCVSVLTGCSLVGRNDQKYYEAVVATIAYESGETDEITKRDLINAYNSYGYNYVQNYGNTMEEAVTKTLDTIVDTRLTVKAVEEHYKNNPSEGDMFIASEKTYLYDATYDGIYSNLRTYYNEVTGNKEYAEETEEEKEASVFTEFEKSAYLQESGSSYLIKKTNPASTIRATYKARNVDGKDVDFEYVNGVGEYVFKDAMYEQLMNLTRVSNTQSAKNWKKAVAKYVDVVKDNYSYIDFESDKDVLVFEMNRVYRIVKENYTVEKYSVIFNRENHQDADVANVTVTDVLAHYSSKVRAAYTKYVLEGDKAAFESDVLKGQSNYILEGNDATEYFYVASVKMAFNEDQKDKYDIYKTAKDNRSITNAQYEKFMDEVYASVYATERNASTGAKTEKTVSAAKLLSDIKEDVKNAGTYDASETSSYNNSVAYNKATAFRKYLYLFNDDDSLKGAEYNTVFGVNASNEVVANSDFSSNDAVKAAIKALYNEGNAQIGDVTELVETEDGIYIFFFAGKVENVFGGIDENFDVSRQPSAITKLSSTRINIFSTKTMFDAIYEELATDNFATFENMNMAYLRSNLVKEDGIVYIKNNLKDMYK